MMIQTTITETVVIPTRNSSFYWRGKERSLLLIWMPYPFTSTGLGENGDRVEISTLRHRRLAFIRIEFEMILKSTRGARLQEVDSRSSDL